MGNQNLVGPILRQIQKMAHENATPDMVMNVLENWSPEVKERLQTSSGWQKLKGKSAEEIEIMATNLLHDPNVVVNVVSAVNPILGEKIQNNPALSALASKGPREMGQFVIGLGRKFGLIN